MHAQLQTLLRYLYIFVEIARFHLLFGLRSFIVQK